MATKRFQSSNLESGNNCQNVFLSQQDILLSTEFDVRASIPRIENFIAYLDFQFLKRAGFIFLQLKNELVGVASVCYGSVIYSALGSRPDNKRVL